MQPPDSPGSKGTARHRSDGPYCWADARLVRYADDFVILAKHVGGRIETFVEQTLQGRFGLTVAGYPRKAFRQINRFVQERPERHLKRRSQRPYRRSDGVTWYAQLLKLGLKPL